MSLQTLDDLPAESERVLLRTDYNVPINDGKVQDTYRVERSVPTIQALQDKGVSQILISCHIGRPDKPSEDTSTEALVPVLRSFLPELKVVHLDKPVPGPEEIPSRDEADIVLLENIRYTAGEIYNSDDVARGLAKLCDTYVNDAFGVGHRKHSSVHAIQHFTPTYYGKLIEKEVAVAAEIIQADNIGVVLGGSKLTSKLPLIQKLGDKSSFIGIGGAMIFPFFAVNGWSTGRGNIEKKSVESAEKVINHEALSLPSDIIVANSATNPTGVRCVEPDEIPEDLLGLDVGPKTVREYTKQLNAADIVVWNGPLGYYETPVFAKATKKLMENLRTHAGKVIIGGGDTGALLHREGIPDSDFYHVSTGGGAFLELLKEETLPVLP